MPVPRGLILTARHVGKGLKEQPKTSMGHMQCMSSSGRGGRQLMQGGQPRGRDGSLQCRRTRLPAVGADCSALESRPTGDAA
jgi:hypothetical protein